MNPQTVVQTSGSNWNTSYSFQRAYYHVQPHPHISLLATHQGANVFAGLEEEMAGYRASQEAILKELQNRFGMVSDGLVAAFLANHRSLPHLLTEAFDRLKEAFGTSIVVNLEVTTDEDGHQTLYAITLWKEDARQAATAFNSFVENWWIHRMSAATSDIAFVYQLI
jgi:hypothetical protein